MHGVDEHDTARVLVHARVVLPAGYDDGGDVSRWQLQRDGQCRGVLAVPVWVLRRCARTGLDELLGRVRHWNVEHDGSDVVHEVP